MTDTRDLLPLETLTVRHMVSLLSRDRFESRLEVFLIQEYFLVVAQLLIHSKFLVCLSLNFLFLTFVLFIPALLDCFEVLLNLLDCLIIVVSVDSNKKRLTIGFEF